jgi:hypothetical protein
MFAAHQFTSRLLAIDIDISRSGIAVEAMLKFVRIADSLLTMR